MPNYVYESAEGEKGCPACNCGFEVFHGMNEPAPVECPRCGGKITRRITAPGLALKWNEKATLSESNLKRCGFKTLHNEGGGKLRVT